VEIINARVSRAYVGTLRVQRFFSPLRAAREKCARETTYWSLPSVRSFVGSKVNYKIRNGSFQLDLRDGEALYFSALPLEGMTHADCKRLIGDW